MINNDYLRKKKNLAARQGNTDAGNALEAESQDTIAQIEEAQMKSKWRRYYISYALHMFIPLYGTFVFIVVMVTTFQGIFG